VFARALDTLAVLSFDFGAMLGGFCIIDMSFYQSLLTSTLLLVAAVAAIMVYQKLRRRRRSGKGSKHGLFAAVYLLLFAYPVISVKVVGAFACHEIEGVLYLRADYNIPCDSPQWKAMAVYAGVWLAIYVVAFPFFILLKLWSYRGSSPAARNTPKSDEKLDMRFLLSDYKPFAPALLWEGIEMGRKLLLSVIGSFWSTKSTMSIVTAFLISVFFLCAHLGYLPFKASVLNRVQTLALTMLTLLYFIGNLPPPFLHTTHLTTTQSPHSPPTRHTTKCGDRGSERS
jgi:hypothetical protein